jgi:predicted short-subunit dehydrogenase-like oxidoreductase (DUF2520 family)
VENALSPKKNLPITIIGAGAVGSALALALHKRKFTLRLVVSHKEESARRLGRKVHAFYGTQRSMPGFEPGGIFFLAVPDDEIEGVARWVAHTGTDFTRSIVFHCSGALSSDLLSPLRRKGAAVGSFHPLQSFPGTKADPQALEKIWIGIEGDRKAKEFGRYLARELRSRSIILSPQQKTLYHLAAVFSSNFLVTILSVVEELGGELGLSRNRVMSMVEPILLRSFMNAKLNSAATALTGPIARGDLRTVRKHRSALRAGGMKRIAALYTALARETAVLASKKDR